MIAEPSKATIVIAPGSLPSSDPGTVVSEKWLLDSIVQYKSLPTKDYRV